MPSSFYPPPRLPSFSLTFLSSLSIPSYPPPPSRSSFPSALYFSCITRNNYLLSSLSVIPSFILIIIPLSHSFPSIPANIYFSPQHLHWANTSERTKARDPLNPCTKRTRSDLLLHQENAKMSLPNERKKKKLLSLNKEQENFACYTESVESLHAAPTERDHFLCLTERTQQFVVPKERDNH